MSLEQLYKEPLNYYKHMSIKILDQFIRKANKMYELGNPIINDIVYDTIIDYIKDTYPNHSILKLIGNETDEKVKLPYHMGSMNKFKKNKDILKWKQKYDSEVVISEKLDGISALLIYNDNDIHNIKMYSRGDGTYGKDISFITKYINLPKMSVNNITLRGELIISKENFKKYEALYSNARNMVSGIVNSKKIDIDILSDIDYVVFEIIKDAPLSEQLKYGCDLGFQCSNYSIENNTILNETTLLEKLINFKKESNYEIDGIIITHNKINKRNREGNPKYSFAFKSNTLGTIVQVTDIIWNVSKHGKIVPTIKFNPIKIDNVNINYTTGFNAKYIVDNKIGKESKIRIIRSGDVIPHITEIIEMSDEPLMPIINYKWNDSKVNIYIQDDNDEHNIKQLLTFFRILEVKNLSIGLITKLYNNGYKTIKDIYNITKEELLQLEGIKDLLANKLYDKIHIAIDKPIPLEQIMAASIIFGANFGIKRLKLIVDKYPKILNQTITVEHINQIHGFNDKTTNQFITKLNDFKLFLNENTFLKIKEISVKKKLKIEGGIFLNKKIVLTDFRDHIIIDFIEKHNGIVVNTISKNIMYLIIKNSDTHNKKTQKAHELNINIITKDDFYKKYLS